MSLDVFYNESKLQPPGTTLKISMQVWNVLPTWQDGRHKLTVCEDILHDFSLGGQDGGTKTKLRKRRLPFGLQPYKKLRSWWEVSEKQGFQQSFFASMPS